MRAVTVAVGALVVAAATAGCTRRMAGPDRDLDETLDRAEALSWCARWSQCASLSGARGALARAQLALDPIPRAVAGFLPCGPQSQLLARGEQDAEHAIRELAQDPDAWQVAARYRLRAGDARGAAERSCRAAELAPSRATLQEECGDLRFALGEVAPAVQAWRQAFVASGDREQQFDLLAKIEGVSQQPSADLASLPQEIVEQYRAWKKGQQGHGGSFDVDVH